MHGSHVHGSCMGPVHSPRIWAHASASPLQRRRRCRSALKKGPRKEGSSKEGSSREVGGVREHGAAQEPVPRVRGSARRPREANRRRNAQRRTRGRAQDKLHRNVRRPQREGREGEGEEGRKEEGRKEEGRKGEGRKEREKGAKGRSCRRRRLSRLRRRPPCRALPFAPSPSPSPFRAFTGVLPFAPSRSSSLSALLGRTGLELSESRVETLDSLALALFLSPAPLRAL